ncbi:hypothetical protein [Streptomyces sp. NBC_00829]|uniref:hypothetical protein n=1 Tax=Streptomyces sp. NBC_00829 TaxID=2903679 RepID=UPI0038660460|nr:hypothetical protein OG293_17955 [Streptomyces sp. NBC_00829]
MNLRMTGLAAAVVFTALLPLAASAGPSDGLWPGSGAAPGDEARPKAEPETEPGLLSALGTADGTDRSDTPEASGVTGAPAPQTSAQCGPELTSPDGIEAQTCVLTEGNDTWARTYYRNATGEELSSALTLMGPGGRTLQINCAVDADDEPGVCEAPRERSRGAVSAYSAVAEFAAADGVGEGPLLLKSGSNSTSSAGR